MEASGSMWKQLRVYGMRVEAEENEQRLVKSAAKKAAGAEKGSGRRLFLIPSFFKFLGHFSPQTQFSNNT